MAIAAMMRHVFAEESQSYLADSQDRDNECLSQRRRLRVPKEKQYCERYLPPTVPSRSRWPDMSKRLPGDILQRLWPNMDRERLAIEPRGGEANQMDGYQENSLENEQDRCAEEQSAVPADIQMEGDEDHRQYAIIGQLPTCWIALQGGMRRALIDTGSQLNVMQLSTARALNVCITETDQSTLPKELQQGMITADGGMDPFVGTAYSVPVSIGGVLIPTHFRIVRRLRRGILLGTPWCSAAQLRIQFDTFGRALCFIKSIDNQREISFIGCDPATTPDALSIGSKGDEQKACLLEGHALCSLFTHKQCLRVHCLKSFSGAWHDIRNTFRF